MAKQLELTYPSAKRVEVPMDRRSEWTHRFIFPRDLPESLVPLLDTLKKYLTITATQHIDFALAFDFYKIPEEGVDPKQWKNSKPAELVSHGKYKVYSPLLRGKALAKLAEGSAAVMSKHPLLASCPTVISFPGHKDDGKSFGELYAAKVAEVMGKTLIKAESTLGPREPAKVNGSAHLMGNLRIRSTLSGSVIIIDDVYRTGGSFRAAGLAARQAGASQVFGIAAVRTLRN
ncbi:MAG: phosphoribosyltransferase [Micromonospora sp.]